MPSESLQQSDTNSEVDEEEAVSDSDDGDSEIDDRDDIRRYLNASPSSSSREEKFSGGLGGGMAIGSLGNRKQSKGSIEGGSSLKASGGGVLLSRQGSHRSRKMNSRKGLKDMPLVAADTSFDVWSLGVVFYQIACNVPLFLCDGDGNMGDSDLRMLAEWSDKVKNDKLAKIKNPLARNLLSIMLQRDPKRRPTIETVLKHPFLSFHRSRPTLVVGGETISREYDVFISYRVASDLPHVELLHRLLQNAGLKVWWDKTRYITTVEPNPNLILTLFYSNPPSLFFYPPLPNLLQPYLL